MRALGPVVLLAAAVLVADATPVSARPPFARREGKACGYCHINPRGGGPRNRRGLLYARNEFSFPVEAGNLNAFERERDREAMVRANRLIDLDHTPAALKQLERLARAVRNDQAAKKLVEEKLHELDVKGTEILGQARLLLRKNDAKARAEGVELLVLLESEYKGLDVYEQAKDDLKEVKRNKEFREIVRREEREAKARELWLDAQRANVDGKPDKAETLLGKLQEKYPDSRAAKLIAKPADEKE